MIKFLIYITLPLEQCRSSNFSSAFKKLRSKVRCKPRDMPVELRSPPNSFVSILHYQIYISTTKITNL